MMHVLSRDGFLDRDFIAANTVGFEEVEEEIGRCTPSWGERTTGVAAALIEEAAHLYGSGPSLLWIGQGLQRQPTGGNVVRAVSLLPAVTGNLGRPGGGFLYLNGIETRGLDGDYLTSAHLAPADPPTMSQMDLAAALEDRARVRALLCWNINIAASSPEQERLRDGAQPERSLHRRRRPLPDRHGRLRRHRPSRIELPRARRPRRLVLSRQPESAGRRSLDPPGEALSNSEIFRRLAARWATTSRSCSSPTRTC